MCVLEEVKARTAPGFGTRADHVVTSVGDFTRGKLLENMPGNKDFF